MNGYLILETGEVYQGLAHATNTDRCGEVVFNTSHSGYEEIATDPSYFSQIVVMTAPMQGNYGVEDAVWESRRIWIEGFVCLQLQKSARDTTWAKRLGEVNVPILHDLDTREIVLRLRSGGTPWGALIVSCKTEDEARERAAQMITERKKTLLEDAQGDWVYEVSRKETQVVKGLNSSGPSVAVLDFGCKENILRELLKRSREICLFNSRANAGEILKYRPDAIMLTNGPGDPADVQVARETVQVLIGNKPIFGICMGHQVLALALGAKTYKLKFGHRGSNHPIQDKLLNKVYMTSQNHGYAVDPKTLPADVAVTQINLNDQTVAGFYSDTRNCLGIQYHPESCPGPHDATPLFDYFFEKMMVKR